MIACYMRLSVADGDLGKDNKDTSNSIENQKAFLHNYIDMHPEFEGDVEDFIDDGFSGTNFNRPAFVKMMEKVKSGNVNTILVKDLSRLGRNYIDVGDYLEQIFPTLGVRFIAIASSYDSNNYIGKTMGLEMSITNLVNTLYCRDISQKYKSARKTRWKQGKSTFAVAPYGYRVNPETKKWQIDQTAAEIVKLIFNKAAIGWNTTMIAHYLNEQGIVTRNQYMNDVKINHVERKLVVPKQERAWTPSMVWEVLKKYEYTGALVQGKTEVLAVGSSVARKNDKNKWVVVENVHEPIISKNLFEQAQAIITPKVKRVGSNKSGFVLAGKVRCGTCRQLMRYTCYKDEYVYCIFKKSAGDAVHCSETKYPVKKLEAIVRNAITTNVQYMLGLQLQLEKKNTQKNENISEKLKKIKDDIEFAKTERMHQYEGYVDGVINKEVYLKRRIELNEKIAGLEENYSKLQEILDNNLRIQDDISEAVEVAEQNNFKSALTREMVEAFIENVYLYDSEHIEIIFKFQDVIKEAEKLLGIFE